MSPGMAVSPDSEQPLAVIGDPDRLWLLLDVPESQAGRLRAGMQVSLAGADGRPLQATLQHVDDFVDSERRVVQARAELDNRARAFKAGQYVRAQVALPAEGGVSLPDAAVLLIDGKQVV
ncbi:efflux RND transporter periplasmic adaptor subunit, partial [Stenotrophomonas maltophilia]|nr:efflux RND transporter periplasmic adaptor subunit [Stenotrophomonas maltophilia]